ncbi:putative flavonoid 3-hydroxylase [Stachybotrys elegans]|uniref:Flavonoid 3-hydroxylase n=1 Tax=Stachybotrys elegans TaxID=80388 RepID=A0A8K0SZ59_9HYPO|nr:putative flavonoid 3-hydroxylase [Stachybotrys elegans]
MALALILPALALFAIYLIAIVLYRLYLHPLAHFPGPKLAAATGYYETYYDTLVSPGGQFAFKLRELHQKYGPIIRINPHEIHVFDTTFIDAIYCGSSQRRRDKYPPTAHMVGTPQGCFGTISHNVHRIRRGPVATFYSKVAVDRAESLIYTNARRLGHTIERHISQDGFAEMRLATLAFSTDTLFAYSFDDKLAWNLLDNDKRAKDWSDTLHAVSEHIPIMRNFPWMMTFAKWSPPWLLQAASPALARMTTLREMMNTQAVSAMASAAGKPQHEEAWTEEQPKLIPSILSSKSLPESEKTVLRLTEEGVESVSAGTDTISRTLTNTVYYILSSPPTVLQRLQEELVSVMPQNDSSPPLKDLEKLTWLTAIIKEALRISALTTSRLPLICPDQTLYYEKWAIPKGTPVGLTPFYMLRDPSIFERPEEFLPERWLPGNPDLDRINHYYIPFNRGSRMCLGQHLAMAEIYIALAVLFRCYKFELYDVVYERDIELIRNCFAGEVSKESPGVRIRMETDA